MVTLPSIHSNKRKRREQERKEDTQRESARKRGNEEEEGKKEEKEETSERSARTLQPGHEGGGPLSKGKLCRLVHHSHSAVSLLSYLYLLEIEHNLPSLCVSYSPHKVQQGNEEERREQEEREQRHPKAASWASDRYRYTRAPVCRRAMTSLAALAAAAEARGAAAAAAAESHAEGLRAALSAHAAALTQQRRRTARLRQDFDYNLQLLRERDAALDSAAVAQAAAAETVDALRREVSEAHARLDAAEQQRRVAAEAAERNTTRKEQQLQRERVRPVGGKVSECVWMCTCACV